MPRRMSPPISRDSETERRKRAGPDENGLLSILGRSETMKSLFRQIQLAGPSAAAVLIVGETGTGKELVARTLHELSPRKSGPSIAVNCAAIPENLVESELFGHEKGAFTGAHSRSAGCFEQASRGTLFLDEISAMPVSQQAKLLRVLQEGRLRRLGAGQEIDVDVRIITAMNVDPEDAMADGRLRSDLFYRLSVFMLRVPPLRERAGDIPLLARHFVREIAGAEWRDETDLDPEASRALSRHRWPGNVRELRNALERAVILAKGRTILKQDLPATIVDGVSMDAREDDSRRAGLVLRAGMTLEEVKRQLILKTLEATGNDVTEASRRLGISSRTIYNRIREWKLSPGRAVESSGVVTGAS